MADTKIVYLAQSSWYGGKASNTCAFSDMHEAIRWARFQAKGFVDFAKFPDPELKYPYDDRDGSNLNLDPVFVANWTKYGGGWSKVTQMEISDVFDWYAINKQPDGTPYPQDWDIPKP
jgi:hypothetical protein